MNLYKLRSRVASVAKGAVAGVAVMAAAVAGLGGVSQAAPTANYTSYATTAVNLRYGPGMGYSVERVVPGHGAVSVVGGPYGPGWYKVSYHGSVGYIWKAFLSRTAGASLGYNLSGEHGMTTAALNMRYGPGMGYGVKRVIPYHGVVTINGGSYHGWYKVSYGGSTGYSWSGYISKNIGGPQAPRASYVRHTTVVRTYSRPATSTYGRAIGVLATGYNGAEFNSSGIMADGNRVHWGAVAVDPTVIPLGTRMHISGFGNTVFVAEDTGSAIKGNRIDIWFPSVAQALQFGGQSRTVYILP